MLYTARASPGNMDMVPDKMSPATRAMLSHGREMDSFEPTVRAGLTLSRLGARIRWGIR